MKSSDHLAADRPFQSWICIVCGWVYDEQLGFEQGGLLPQTRWENVPPDWGCPDCGVSKHDFEMVPL
jgi:rubredoxin